MKIPRFLALGSGLSGFRSKPKTYRVLDSGLPRLSGPKAQELSALCQGQAANPEVRESAAAFAVAGPAIRRRDGLLRRGWRQFVAVVTAWIPTSQPSRTAVQTELRLEAVRPLRSPLFDDDLQVVKKARVPVQPLVAEVPVAMPAAEPAVEGAPVPFERAIQRSRWNRLSGWFRSTEKAAAEKSTITN